MRVEYWDATGLDKIVTETGIRRVRKAAKVIADAARRKCPVGTISRPMYKTGRYHDKPWTARDAGQLKKSVRVVERHAEKYGFELAQFETLGHYGSVRVYAGNFLAYYASIVEFNTPFMRPALMETRSEVKRILEDG